jgi:hydrogenase maturation protease
MREREQRILVAGIGNIFMGDDAFGVEVVRELARRELPKGVAAEDFGIRSYDLAYALTAGYEAVILVDATPRGEAPGTTFLIELDADEAPGFQAHLPDGHSLDAVGALQLARSLGRLSAKLYLVGCEPAVLEVEQIGLSPAVQAAVPQASGLIEEVLRSLLNSQNAGACCLVTG